MFCMAGWSTTESEVWKKKIGALIPYMSNKCAMWFYQYYCTTWYFIYNLTTLAHLNLMANVHPPLGKDGHPNCPCHPNIPLGRQYWTSLTYTAWDKPKCCVRIKFHAFYANYTSVMANNLHYNSTFLQYLKLIYKQHKQNKCIVPCNTIHHLAFKTLFEWYINLILKVGYRVEW